MIKQRYFLLDSGAGVLNAFLEEDLEKDKIEYDVDCEILNKTGKVLFRVEWDED